MNQEKSKLFRLLFMITILNDPLHICEKFGIWLKCDEYYIHQKIASFIEVEKNEEFWMEAIS